MNPFPIGACYACSQLTGGRCWRHSVVVANVGATRIVGWVTILPLPDLNTTTGGRPINEEAVGVMRPLNWTKDRNGTHLGLHPENVNGGGLVARVWKDSFGTWRWDIRGKISKQPAAHWKDGRRIRDCRGVAQGAEAARRAAEAAMGEAIA